MSAANRRTLNVTLMQMLADPQRQREYATRHGLELIVHVHPEHLIEGENPRNPYGYMGIKGSRVVVLADKLVIHLAEGGQFVAKDKFNTQSVGVVPPFVQSGEAAKTGIRWRVAVAGATVLCCVVGAAFDLSRNMTLGILLVIVGAVLIRSVGELLGEDIGVLPGDEPQNGRQINR